LVKIGQKSRTHYVETWVTFILLTAVRNVLCILSSAFPCQRSEDLYIGQQLVGQQQYKKKKSVESRFTQELSHERTTLLRYIAPTVPFPFPCVGVSGLFWGKYLLRSLFREKAW